MNIILTAIGSMSALCAINQLHAGGHKVIGCDIYPYRWHYEASLCDVFKQAPRATVSNEYIPFLLRLAEEYDAKYLFPLTDLEIDVIGNHLDDFEKRGITVCMPSLDTLSIVRNKYLLFETFKDDVKVPSIPTYIEKELSGLCYPCVAKPRDGRSSEGLYYLQSPEQLVMIKDLGRYIFQKKIEGQVYTVDFVRDPKTGISYSIPREELLRTKNGAGIAVRIFHDSYLDSLVSYIGEKLGIIGVVNMEFIRSEDNYYLIDINPRFSAGIAFSCMSGYDFVTAHLNCFTGLLIPEMNKYYDGIRIKYYIEK